MFRKGLLKESEMLSGRDSRQNSQYLALLFGDLEQS